MTSPLKGDPASGRADNTPPMPFVVKSDIYHSSGAHSEGSGNQINGNNTEYHSHTEHHHHTEHHNIFTEHHRTEYASRTEFHSHTKYHFHTEHHNRTENYDQSRSFNLNIRIDSSSLFFLARLLPPRVLEWECDFLVHGILLVVVGLAHYWLLS
ncbi:hypothetical protein FIE12Z_1036 [Fusarium flagelliforme]|uniref:Uncharacterized protein n=1 Tax=Fusarium flagelliforme TaxID=2675880 RepID=A0A395N3K2_9HYPO|nr:hypothetical protein FIE12Z_1036 [Fusarium flagelliforme]